jgi:hypothetical protein
LAVHTVFTLIVKCLKNIIDYFTNVVEDKQNPPITEYLFDIIIPCPFDISLLKKTKNVDKNTKENEKVNENVDKNVNENVNESVDKNTKENENIDKNIDKKINEKVIVDKKVNETIESKKTVEKNKKEFKKDE